MPGWLSADFSGAKPLWKFFWLPSAFRFASRLLPSPLFFTVPSPSLPLLCIPPLFPLPSVLCHFYTPGGRELRVIASPFLFPFPGLRVSGFSPFLRRSLLGFDSDNTARTQSCRTEATTALAAPTEATLGKPPSFRSICECCVLGAGYLCYQSQTRMEFKFCSGSAGVACFPV